MRALPTLYKALVPGAPEHRVKGALHQINMPAFAKYAMTGIFTDRIRTGWLTWSVSRTNLSGAVRQSTVFVSSI